MSTARLDPVGLETVPAFDSTRTPTLWNDLRQSYPGNRLELATQFLSEFVESLTTESVNPLPESRFLELGMDSLMIVELSSQVQAEVGGDAQIPATLVFDYPSVSQLAQFLVTTFESAQVPLAAPADRTIAANGVEPLQAGLHEQVQAMSEEQALSELMRELEDS
jgi:acyl carrier protein